MEIHSDVNRATVESAARAEFGDAISSRPLLQIWSQEWDSWVDLRDDDAVPSMSKILILPQLEDLAQVVAVSEWLKCAGSSMCCTIF